ncbi:MAG TPA: hypothetical protein VIX37_18180 [Candidatus Sulfotelmatobacter sp.]
MPKASIPIRPYPGVGDEAWVNLWNVLTACKGQAGVVMELRYYHDSDELMNSPKCWPAPRACACEIRDPISPPLAKAFVEDQ